MTEKELCNYETCKQCGGECCKTMGCEIYPDDFNVTIDIDALRLLFKTNAVSLDQWDGDPRDGTRYQAPKDESAGCGMYIRIRNKDAEPLDFSWGGVCSLLSDDGCMLPFSSRPYGGRCVIPKDKDHKYCYLPDDFDSEIDSTKQLCAIKWLPYESELRSLENLLYDNDPSEEFNTITDINKIKEIFSTVFKHHE